VDEVCALIVEPLVQCAAGMKIYPPVYLLKLRQLCDHLHIHLIADEIAVGFGRTGKMFACNHAGISPDIMCVSKGITGGYLPLSAALVTEDIYQAFYGDYTEQKAFLHSHTYAGNPLACACALEVLNIFAEGGLLEANERKARFLAELVQERAAHHPFVGEFRQRGMIAALELVADKETRRPFDWRERVGYRIYRIALDKGLLIRPLGDVLYFMPPFCVEEGDLEFMVTTTFSAMDEYFQSVR